MNIRYFNTAERTFALGNVYISEGHFVYCGKEQLECTHTLDGTGLTMIPGLIDIHMHIESSMTTPTEFSNTVLPLGTTTIVADAHEIANVFGYEGLIEYMEPTPPLDIYYAIPSSVPSTHPDLETTGGIITEREVALLCNHPKIIALGEIMNSKDVACAKDSQTQRILKTFKAMKPTAPIEGHIPRIEGLELARFIHSGVGSDHTQQTPESIREKIANGLLIQFQEKSIHPETMQCLNDFNLHGFYCLVTDDVMPDDLLSKGHLNHCLKRAVACGLSFEDAVFASTYVPAQRMQLYDRGMIAPGKLADFILLKDNDTFDIAAVYKKGVSVSELCRETLPISNSMMQKTIHTVPLTLEDFKVTSDKEVETVRVMKRNAENTFTEAVTCQVSVKNGEVQWQNAGLNLIMVVERYGKGSKPALGFVEGGFSEDGAMATTWAHDHHNLLIMGTNIEKMLACAKTLIEVQGGMVVYDEAMTLLPLRYGGIVSLESMQTLALQCSKIRESMKRLGYRSHNEIMSFSVLSLLVSPDLKISDKGYVSVKTQEILDWRV